MSKSHDNHIFAIVPIEVLQDRRLTYEQTRVLVALLSFRGKNTDVVWPSRQAIAERTGLHVSNVSSATTALVELGWLKKRGNGGKSKASQYRISVPDRFETIIKKTTAKKTKTVARKATVAESATSKNPASVTVAESATQTVAESARGRVAESAISTVAESARGKELTKEHTNELTKEQTILVTTPPIAKSKTTPKLTPEAKAAQREAERETKAQAKAQERAAKAEAKAAASREAEERLQTACRTAWASFVAAYEARYGERPVRNEVTNSQFKRFVRRIGYDESPAVAAFYLSVSREYYVARLHPVDCLLKDCEGLRTQWATNRRVTTTSARDIDRASTNLENYNEASQLVAARRAARTPPESGPGDIKALGA